MTEISLQTTFEGTQGTSFTSGTRPAVSPDGLLLVDLRIGAITVFERGSLNEPFTFVEANNAAGNDGFGNLIEPDFLRSRLFRRTVIFST
jgi:hypothetical protein